MLKALLLGLLLTVCSCSAHHTPPGTRVIHGLMLVTGGSAHNGEAVSTWDENGLPIETIPDNDTVVRQLDALTPKNRNCYGIFYEATFAIKDQKHFRALNATSALLAKIIGVHPSNRNDPELRRLLHKIDIGASVDCVAGADGNLRPIPDTYVTGSRLAAQASNSNTTAH